jgi:hypothetical protein
LYKNEEEEEEDEEEEEEEKEEEEEGGGEATVLIAERTQNSAWLHYMLLYQTTRFTISH